MPSSYERSLPLPGNGIYPVVGVTFVSTYPDNLHQLEALWHQEGHHEEGLAVVLRRNPLNEHDQNAIEVHVPALSGDFMVGHLPAAIAARLAPELDGGAEWRSHLVEVLIHSDHPDRPGIRVRLQRVIHDD